MVRPNHSVKLNRQQREQLFGWFGDQERGPSPADRKAPADPQLAKALEVLRAALEKKKEAAGS
jgi:hypothetical protein